MKTVKFLSSTKANDRPGKHSADDNSNIQDIMHNRQLPPNDPSLCVTQPKPLLILWQDQLEAVVAAGYASSSPDGGYVTENASCSS